MKQKLLRHKNQACFGSCGRKRARRDRQEEFRVSGGQYCPYYSCLPSITVRPTRNKLSQAAIEGKPQEDAYSDTDEEDEDQEEEEDPDEKLIKPMEQLKDSDIAKPLGKVAGGKKKAPDRANYRKLKIKSKNSKPKGRFGRRR